MASVLQLFFGIGNDAQCTASPEEVNFFSGLDIKGRPKQRHAILEAVVLFTGDELSKVIRRLQTQYYSNMDVKDDDSGKSALHILADKILQKPASVSAILENLYSLLEADIDPNLQDTDKNTLLHLLVERIEDIRAHININDYLSFIQYLVEAKGADLTIKNKFGNTALHELVQHGDDLIVEATLNQPAINTVNFLIQLAKNSHCFYMIKWSRNIDGNSLLHLAAIHGQPKTVQCLLDLEWKSHWKNKDGVTPLHYAVLGKTEPYIHVVNALLATNKIDMNVHIKALDYNVTDINQCMLQYVHYLNQQGNRKPDNICEIVHSKLPKTDNSTSYLQDIELDIEQKVSEIGQHIYYTASQNKHYPQLYVPNLNTRSKMIHDYYDTKKNVMGSWSFFHTHELTSKPVCVLAQQNN